MENIYEEVFQLQEEQIEVLKRDVMDKYEKASKTFSGVPNDEQEFLKKFSFICLLGFDVYIKKMLIEKLVDDLKNTDKDTKKMEK